MSPGPSAALEELRVLRAAVEDMDRKLEVESSDQDGFVQWYRVPCGPWHRILGLVRGGLWPGFVEERLTPPETEPRPEDP